MRKYLSEIIILGIQVLIFYILPMFMHLLYPIGVVILMLLSTFILSWLLAIVSKNKIKYFFPFVISILFLPTIFIYYNESALIHSIWYLIISIVGLFIGFIIKMLIIRK